VVDLGGCQDYLLVGLMKTKFNSIFGWRAPILAGLLALAIVAPASAVEFYTPRALLSQHFHSSEKVSFVRVNLDAQQRARIEARIGRPLAKKTFTFFVASTASRVDGYALFDEELGQHEPISFVTFFDGEGRVTRVEIVAYREPYGDGIRAERFRKQFIGRSVSSHFRPGTDIDAISGATISSRSMCVGVERATALFDETMAKQARSALATR
jgi:electron transport complex protein RnfG